MADIQAQQSLETIEIGSGAYRIENGGVRMYLFVGSEKALLVDTGFGNAGSVREAVAALTDKPVMLVNTHADDDHTGRNDEFDVAYMHPAEMPYYHDKKGRYPVTPAAPLWDGDIIDLGGRKFEVILLPGHTPGSIALLDRENRIIVTGDSVSDSPVFMFLPIRDIHAHMASMERLLSISDSFDDIYPSHGTFPIKANQASKLIATAKKLLAGELEPADPPFPMPAKMYSYDGASYFYSMD